MNRENMLKVADKTDATRLFVPDNISYINLNVDLVPDALRWMALTGNINWDRAINAAWCVKEKR